jgi:hypothetical protein
MGCANSCAASPARLAGVGIQIGWSVSYCALLRTEPHPSSPFPQTLHIYFLALLVVSRRTYVDSERIYISETGMFGSDNKKGLFRRNHRERVVDHTDDRVEFSRHTLFSLPVVLVPQR